MKWPMMRGRPPAAANPSADGAHRASMDLIDLTADHPGSRFDALHLVNQVRKRQKLEAERLRLLTEVHTAAARALGRGGPNRPARAACLMIMKDWRA